MTGAHHKPKRGLRAASAAGTLCLCAGAARGQVFEWGVQFGTPQFDTARRIVPDGQGGVYLAGSTEGSLAGPTHGIWDAYLARYGRDGARLWDRQLGTGALDSGFAVAPDGQGGVYLAGETAGNLGGPQIGVDDNFLARYDGNGALLWVHQFGTPQNEAEPSLAPADAGGVYVYSATDGSFGAPNAGSLDPYLARLDAAGNQLWVRQFGSAGIDGGGDIAPDGAGGAFIAGVTNGSLGGPNAGQMDVYIGRYDREGNRLWLIQFGSALGDWAWGCASDGAGGVYVVGETFGDLAGPLPGERASDAFIVRYNGQGERLWARQFGALSRHDLDVASAAAPDGRGGVLVAGRTTGNLAAPNAGFWDVFFARYDAGGERVWAGQFGTGGPPPFGGEERTAGVASDGLGGIFVSGATNQGLWGVNQGSFDGVLGRYSVPCYADCDTETGPGSLDIFDFLCFLNRYAAGLPYACDCDTSTGQGVCDIFDFLCFQDAFGAGCS